MHRDPAQDRLARECAKLDPVEERELAEEGAEDLADWLVFNQETK